MKTFREFIEIVEGKVEWDNPRRPLQSGLTPREKNRAVRKRLGIENPDVVDNPSFFKGGPSERDYERYGKLQAAHESEKDKKVPKDKRHEFAVYAKGRLGGKYSLGKIRRMAGIHKGAKTGRSAEKGTGTYAVMSQVQGGEKVIEKHKKRYGDYADLRRLQEPKESFEYELEEGKVEWDNPRRPLQSGLTPREKNRAKRISTGVENPDKVSFYGKSFDLGDKEYERYGKLQAAHDEQKGKKVPKDKRHEFKQIEDIEGTLVGTRGRKRRKWNQQRNINQPNHPKLYRNDERERNYLLSNLKEPKESFDYSIEEGKIPWDDQNRPLRSGWTPREKNRAKRISTEIENPEHSPTEKQLERYGKLKSAHDEQKNVKTRKDQRHKNPMDYSVGRRNVVVNPDYRMPSENIKGHGELGLQRIPRNSLFNKPNATEDDYKKADEDMKTRKFGAKNDEKRDEYYKKGPKGLKEPKESFDYELEESSTGESLGRRQRERITGGRAFRKMNRDERTTASIAKRAGIRGTGRLSTKDLRDRTPIYTTYKPTSEWGDKGSTKVSTYITSFPSTRAAMKGADVGIIKKKEPKDPERRWGPQKHISSKDSVRRARDFRKAIVRSGGNKRGKVHDTSVVQDDIAREKNDPKGRQAIGRNFIQALRDMPKHREKVGAKKGDIVTGKPSAVVSGEDEDKGAKIRAKLYKKIFGKRVTKRSPKTGLMLGKV